LLAILQTTVLPHLPILGLIPNIIFLTVLAWSFHRGPNEGTVWALIGGLASDLASGAPLGISPVPMMVAALLAGASYRRVYRGNLVLPALISLVSISVFQILYVILLALVSQPMRLPAGAWHIGAPLIILHLVLMPLFFFAVAWLVQLIEGPRIQVG